MKIKFSIFVLTILLAYSCKKITEKTSEENYSYAMLKNASEYAGELHNLILDSSGKKFLQTDRSLNSYEREVFKIIKIGNYDVNSNSEHLRFQPKSINNVNDYVNNMTLLSKVEKEYIIKVCNIILYSSTLDDLDFKLNKLLHDLANDQSINELNKMNVALSAGVGKYSYIYWSNARINKNNPYNILQREQNTSSSFPIFSCSELVDLGALSQAYDYYLSGGYPPAEARAAAIQDAAYNSGLSNLPGGSCGL